MHRKTEKNKVHMLDRARFGFMFRHLFIASLAFPPTITHASRDHADRMLASLLLSSHLRSPFSLPSVISSPSATPRAPKPNSQGSFGLDSPPPQLLSDKSTCRYDRLWRACG